MGKPSETFRNYLSEAIKSGKIKKSPLSQKTSITRPQLDRYISGESVPDLDAAQAIADALGVPLIEMLGTPPAHSAMDCLIRVRELFQTIDSDPNRVIRDLLKGRKK